MNIINMTSKSEPENHRQYEFNQVVNWASEIKMNLNLKKVKEIVIQKKRLPPPEPVKFQNRLIELEKSEKILGVILDKNLSFKEHIECTKKEMQFQNTLIRRTEKIRLQQRRTESSILSTMLYGYSSVPHNQTRNQILKKHSY